MLAADLDGLGRHLAEILDHNTSALTVNSCKSCAVRALFAIWFIGGRADCILRPAFRAHEP